MSARKKKYLLMTLGFVPLIIVLLAVAKKKTIRPPEQPAGVSEPEKFNVVILSIETQRADHLGCYGYSRNTSPFIDSIAKEGILFENHFTSQSSTWPSLTSMLTSLYPVSTSVRINGDMLPPDIPTLADILEKNGYETAAFLGAFCKAGRFFNHKVCSNDRIIVKEANKWLEQNADKPFFMWMHFKAPHYPYTPPEKYDVFTDKNYNGKYDGSKKSVDDITLDRIKLSDKDLNHIISLYDGEVLLADAYIRRVYKKLENLGLADKSIIIITADHGEDLYQRNFYFYHSASIYDSTLHIPLIIRLPGSTITGKRVRDIVENIDIAPTILELLHIPRPSHFEGKSMLSLIQNDSAQDDLSIALGERWVKPSNILSIRTRKWRYIYNPDNIHPQSIKPIYKYKIDEEELYDLEKDPGEVNNIVAQHPDIVEELRKKMLALYPSGKGNKEAIKADEETLEQLRALGYIEM